MDITYNREKIMKLLESFYNITGLRMGVFDFNLQEICVYPVEHCEFCNIIKENEKSAQLCHECDKQAFKNAKIAGDTYIYQCHAGLTEACTVLRHGKAIVGYIMIGQIFSSDITFNKIRQICLNKCNDMDELMSVFYRTKKCSNSIINSAALILEACAGYIYIGELMKNHISSPSTKIERYIENNLSSKLTIRSISQKVQMSTTSVCTCVKSNFGTSVNKFIEDKRMKLAKELLNDTENKQSIFKIAEKCGYSDANYFSKRFKYYYGSCPSKYE